MRKIILIGIVLTAMSYISCTNGNDDDSINEYYSNGTKQKAQSFSRDTAKFEEGAAYYQCPNHSDVVSGREGECPKCGSMLEAHEKQ